MGRKKEMKTFEPITIENIEAFIKEDKEVSMLKDLTIADIISKFKNDEDKADGFKLLNIMASGMYLSGYCKASRDLAKAIKDQLDHDKKPKN